MLAAVQFNGLAARSRASADHAGGDHGHIGLRLAEV